METAVLLIFISAEYPPEKGNPYCSVSQRGGREREKTREELGQEVTPGLGYTRNLNSQMGILLSWILLFHLGINLLQSIYGNQYGIYLK